MLTPELQVLKPIDSSISNSDDYEIFILSNARVYYTANGKPANLLVAHVDTPLRVEGRLENPDKSQQKYLLKRPFRPVEIEIKNVMRFSYGQTEDGEIVIWALGEAGWFEINPAPAYKDTFQDMLEAVQLWYFILDVHQELKKGKYPSTELLFQECAEDERFPCKNPVEAEKLFRKHQKFLVMSLVMNTQGLKWGITPLYVYFKSVAPNEVVIARNRMEGKKGKDVYDGADYKIRAAQKSQPPKQARGIPKANDLPKKEVPKKDENWWEAAVIWEFMQKLMVQGIVDREEVTLQRLAELMVKRFEIDETKTAENYIHIHASNLCYMMEHPRRRTFKYFKEEPIFEQLKRGHSLSAMEVRQTMLLTLRPRKTYQSLKKEDLTDSEEDSRSSSTLTPVHRPPSNKGKFSALRPKSNKYSSKGGKGSKGKEVRRESPIETDVTSLEDAQMDSEDEVGTPTQSLPPSLGNRKRTAQHFELTSRPRKRAPSQSVEPASPVSDTPESEDEEDTDTEAEELLPLKWRQSSEPEDIKLVAPVLVSTPLPSLQANLPGDSWLCPFDGCMQKFYAASTEKGKELIQEHVQDHAGAKQAALELVMTEEQKLRLPVSNLLRRIREMAKTVEPLFPEDMEKPFPEPIRY